MTVAQKERIKKSPIENKSVLNEAYDYASKVSFVRGMRVELDNCTMLFISGTASVNEAGESVHAGDVKAQTRRTFHNITGLLECEGADWHDITPENYRELSERIQAENTPGACEAGRAFE